MGQPAANGSLSISLLNREHSGNLANWILGFGLCTPINPDVLVTYAGFACAVLAHCVTPVDWTRTRAGRMPVALLCRRRCYGDRPPPGPSTTAPAPGACADCSFRRRAQPGRRRVGRKAARGAAHLCDPVAVEPDPVDYGAGNLGLELRVVTGRKELHRRGRRARISRSVPASIAAVNDARRHCQTHWSGPAEPIIRRPDRILGIACRRLRVAGNRSLSP